MFDPTVAVLMTLLFVVLAALMHARWGVFSDE